MAVDIDAAAAARTVELARAIGGDVHAATVDVSDADAMDDLAKSVLAEHGVVDVLVNNAGIGIAGPFLDTPVEDWRRTLDVNLFGVIHGCRAFARQMVERGEGGHIVNVASAAAFQPSKGLPAYSTSKAAVLMLTECLRADFAGERHRRDRHLPRHRRHQHHPHHPLRRARCGRRGTRPAAETHPPVPPADFPPEKVADAIVNAVRDNVAVVAVTPEAAMIHRLSRFAPGLLRRLARVDTAAVTAAASATPAIRARRVSFDWESTPLQWIPDDPGTSHVINVLHLLLPAGERWFVDVYREALPLVTDPALREQVKGFMGQEAVHAARHQAVLDHYVRQRPRRTPYTRRDRLAVRDAAVAGARYPAL